MARIFTWTGRGGDVGQALLVKQFTKSRIQSTYPKMSYIAKMGGYCIDINNFGASAGVDLGSAKSEIYVAFRVMRSSYYSSNLMLEFMLGSTYLGTMSVLAGGISQPQFPKLAVYSAHNGTLLTTGGRFDANNVDVFFVEVYYKPAASGGRWIVKLNGRTAIDFTGDTVPGTESTVDTVHFGAGGYTNNIYFYYNDIVIDDANWPGMSQMVQLAPTGAGNYAQWVPTTSPNWDCVNECPPSKADSNKTNTADDSDSFAVADLPVEVATVNGVSIWAWGLKENAPTPTQIKALVRTGSTPTDYVGSGVTAGIYDTFISGFWATNPYTTQPWVLSEVNGMEIGVKSAA
jgi:hypothetical protein